MRDRVQGDVKFPNKDLDDFIILRSDGVPTYMHAVVVDDHDMGVTHIIRGDDHLTNAARQQIIYDAMGWDIPVMAHIPLIHGADGAKLSKRHGALGVDAYRAMGYLPAALRNYLARLGWSHGDDEVMSLDDMIRWFEIEDVNKGAARFDFAKLEALNGVHMRKMDDAELLDIFIRTLPYLENGKTIADRLDDSAQGAASGGDAGAEGARQDAGRTRRRRGVPVCRAAARRSTRRRRRCSASRSATSCAARSTRCEAVEGEWNAASTEASDPRLSPRRSGLKLGAVAQPLRAALTGRTHVARRVRRARGARPRRKPGADRGSNRLGQCRCHF